MKDYTKEYAKYYDLLTEHKDYALEIELLSKFLGEEGFTNSARLLSVGCGTGSHEKLLAKHFVKVVGIDRAQHMISFGRQKNKATNLILKNIDLFDLAEDNFDIVISLFNVVNCIDSIEALKEFFKEIYQKMRPGGIMVTELWNPVTTLLDPPQVVTRRYKSNDIELTRVATPFLDPNEDLLRLEYKIEGMADNDCVSIISSHNIHLYSRRVIEYCLRKVGFGPPTWYSALSEGLKSTAFEERMLLLCARKSA